MLCWWVRVHSGQGQLGSVFSHVSTVGTVKQFHISDHPHVGNPKQKRKKKTHTHSLSLSSSILYEECSNEKNANIFL
jgi:hypothetical protein